MKGLKGKNVLVTGATSGIGSAIAARFVAEGANVGLNYRNDINKLKDTKELIAKMQSQLDNYDGKQLPVEGDVSQEEDIIRMCNEVVEKLGGLDILINNAGLQTAAASHQVETADFDKVINVNLRGAYLCAREAIKNFLSRGQGGIIINVSSVHEIIPRPQYISYLIAKGGDDFADYSEFTFESKLYVSQIIIDRQNNLLQQKYKFLVISNPQIGSAQPQEISNLTC